MQDVVVRVVHGDRLEGSGADRERQVRDLDAAGADALEDAVVKCSPAVGAATASGSRAKMVW